MKRGANSSSACRSPHSRRVLFSLEVSLFRRHNRSRSLPLQAKRLGAVALGVEDLVALQLRGRDPVFGRDRVEIRLERARDRLLLPPESLGLLARAADGIAEGRRFLTRADEVLQLLAGDLYLSGERLDTGAESLRLQLLVAQLQGLA